MLRLKHRVPDRPYVEDEPANEEDNYAADHSGDGMKPMHYIEVERERDSGDAEYED